MYALKKRASNENIKVDIYDIYNNVNLDKIINRKSKTMSYAAYVFYFETHTGNLQKISHLVSNTSGFNISGNNVLPITINLLNKTIVVTKELNYKFNGVVSFDLDMYAFKVKKISILNNLQKIKQYFNTF